MRGDCWAGLEESNMNLHLWHASLIPGSGFNPRFFFLNIISELVPGIIPAHTGSRKCKLLPCATRSTEIGPTPGLVDQEFPNYHQGLSFFIFLCQGPLQGVYRDDRRGYKEAAASLSIFLEVSQQALLLKLPQICILNPNTGKQKDVSGLLLL